MKIKDSELKAILSEVESEIDNLLKSDAKTLAKAVGDKDPEDGGNAASAGSESAAPAEGSAPAAEASSPTAGSPAPGAEASAGTPPPAAETSNPAPEASASAPGAAAPEMEGPVDPEALKQEYMQLDPESLKVHYMACKAALFEVMGQQAGGSPAPAPEASAPVAPPAPAAPPPAMKAEIPASIKTVPANGDALKDSKAALHDVKPLGKAEQVQQTEEINDLRQQVELLTKAVDLALGTPVRKAVTSITHVPRTENQSEKTELTKDQIQGKIRKALAAGKLTKNQKDQIFSYTLGNTKFDEISALLETK
jgi:hypothetical protein